MGSMKTWQAVVLTWAWTKTTLWGFPLPEGDFYIDETSLDDWLDAAILREEEWEQLQEWTLFPWIGKLAPEEEELVPIALVSPGIRRAVVWEPVRDFVREQPPHRNRFVFVQRGSNTLGDGNPPFSSGFMRYILSESTRLGWTNVAGQKAWTWDDRRRKAHRQDPTRLLGGYLVHQPQKGIRFLVGDFGVGFGSGLVLNTARRRYPRGPVPNETTTARERGLLLEYRSRKYGGTAFLSQNRLPTSLPPSVSGLETTTTIERALERRSLGVHGEKITSTTTIGITFATHRDRNRADPTAKETPQHIAFGIDGKGERPGFRWQGELAYSGGLAGWFEGKRSQRHLETTLFAYGFASDYRNVLSSRRGDRVGVEVRIEVSPATSWRIGSRFTSEQRLSTRTTSQQGRIWCSVPILGKMRGNIAFSWRNPEILSERNSSRIDGGVQVPWGWMTLRVRWTERWNPRRSEQKSEMTWSWGGSRRVSIGGKNEKGVPREFHVAYSGPMGKAMRLYGVISRRDTTTTLRMTVDGTW